MKISQNVLVSLALSLLCVPALGAQKFSKYREFSLGSSLNSVTKQTGVTVDEIKAIHQAPVLMQKITYWPGESGDAPTQPEAVQQLELSFCNGKLYSVNVLYRTSATEGLSDEDMIQAVSATYGVATRLAAGKAPAEPLSFNTADVQLAIWEDSQSSATLSRSPLSQSFHMMILSKQLQIEADAATAQDVAQEAADAPERASERARQEAQDQKDIREANIKAFRP